jgi:hypothetical protein
MSFSVNAPQGPELQRHTFDCPCLKAHHPRATHPKPLFCLHLAKRVEFALTPTWSAHYFPSNVGSEPTKQTKIQEIANPHHVGKSPQPIQKDLQSMATPP